MGFRKAFLKTLTEAFVVPTVLVLLLAIFLIEIPFALLISLILDKWWDWQITRTVMAGIERFLDKLGI